MLSVLIPTYNYVCYQLVADLQKQLETSGEQYEVIVADDGSTDKQAVEANSKVNDLPGCRYLCKTRNIGRAAIRNFLVREAQGEWLLFLDNDARVIKDDFIAYYLKIINDSYNADMIVGGMRHPETLPSQDVTLRYRYEKKADRHRSAAERQKFPYLHLTFFNLCVKKNVLIDTPFDENCLEYGYEDALLGVELEERGIILKHVDNPMEHVGLESNDIYLDKVETALRTLHSLGNKMVPYSHVGKASAKLRSWHLETLSIWLFNIFKPVFRNNLIGKNPSLFILQLYKLGYFLSLKK